MESSGAKRRTLVLHVLPQDLNRGAQVYAGELRDNLTEDAAQEHAVVTLFTGSAGGARPDISLNVAPGRGRRVVDLRAVWRLHRLVRDRRADVLVAHGGEALKYVIAAAGNRPTVYYKVGLSSAEISRPLHRRFYRFLSRRATRVVGNSTAILDQVTAVFGVPKACQSLIPNSRDPRVYRPLRGWERAVDPPRILFVGQLEVGKRPGVFLDMVETLRQRGLRFDASMAGDGPLRASLEYRAQQLGTRLLGTRADIPELIRESAVVVMTSAPDTEGMPGVLIEAGLSAVPVVATTAAGVADVVDHGVTGWVVEGREPNDLAEHVAELLQDADLRATMGQNARWRCATHFSTDAASGLWHDLISELTDRTRRLDSKQNRWGGA